ncbi:MAG: heme-degrading domain-containing protein [Mesorhizobium sp.]
MAEIDDIKRIIEQEKLLIFSSFDEERAFALGSLLRDRAARRELSIAIDIRLWDRSLFYCALPGATAANAEWTRRKINSVRHFQKPTYRLFLETGEQMVPARHGLNPADFVFSGGAFPIRVLGAAIIGAVAVSGLPQREDHNLVVATLAEFLGIDPLTVALGPE